MYSSICFSENCTGRTSLDLDGLNLQLQNCLELQILKFWRINHDLLEVFADNFNK